MLTPSIGERYRDTARDLAHITHLARFRDARLQRDAEREDRLMRALMPMATTRNATLYEIERAKAAAIDQLNANRSMACAIQCAEKHLPRATPRATQPLAG